MIDQTAGEEGGGKPHAFLSGCCAQRRIYRGARILYPLEIALKFLSVVHIRAMDRANTIVSLFTLMCGRYMQFCPQQRDIDSDFRSCLASAAYTCTRVTLARDLRKLSNTSTSSSSSSSSNDGHGY